MTKLILDGRSLTLADVEAVLAGEARIHPAPGALRRVKRSRGVVERAVRNGRKVYGVTTGFGKLSDVAIPPDKLQELQKNVVVSHATGVGPSLSIPEIRLMMTFRVNTLLSGCSGVSEEMIHALIAMVNRGVYPVVPEQGSAGASGDLSPLAHIGIGMMGLGSVYYLPRPFGGRQRDPRTIERKHTDDDGQKGGVSVVISARDGLKRAGLKPYEFKAKEGISLVNGTQLMSAVLGNVLVRARRILRVADIAGAMTLEALKGSLKPFDPRVHDVRPHPGQQQVARNFRKLLRGSGILESHRDCPKIQDAYSLRCIPQVHGAVRDTLAFAESVFLREINSSVDNPLVFDNGDIVSGGNFHGQPLAIAGDALSMVLTTLGNISERRIDRLTNPDLSELPAFLVAESGLNSGMMTVQVNSSALAAENRVLSYPASVTTLPTSASKEDHVSMGPISVRHARAILNNVEYILSFELLCAAQGLEFLKPLLPGGGVEAAYRTVRKYVPPLQRDRYMKDDLDAAKRLVSGEELLKAVTGKAGDLE